VNRRTLAYAAVGCSGLVVVAFVALLGSGTGISGEVVDARSGRVAALATLTYDGRLLHRFHSKDFAFAGGAAGTATLTVEAPGYDPVNLEVAAGARMLRVAMTPRSIPRLSGVVVFPKQVGAKLLLPAQLLDGAGQTMPEFPAVDVTARLVIASDTGAPVGAVDLKPRLDYGGAEMAIGLDADVPAIAVAARPNGATFAVALTAGGKTVTSRPFSLPPAAAPTRNTQ